MIIKRIINKDIPFGHGIVVGTVDKAGSLTYGNVKRVSFKIDTGDIDITFGPDGAIMSCFRKGNTVGKIRKQFLVSSDDVSYNIFTVEDTWNSQQYEHVFVYNTSTDDVDACLFDKSISTKYQQMCYSEKNNIAFVVSRKRADIFFIKHRYKTALSISKQNDVYCGIYILESLKNSNILLGLSTLKPFTYKDNISKEYDNDKFEIESLAYIYDIKQLNEIIENDTITEESLYKIVLDPDGYKTFNYSEHRPSSYYIDIGFVEHKEKRLFPMQDYPLITKPLLKLGRLSYGVVHELDFQDSIFNPEFDTNKPPYINLKGFNLAR